MGYFLRFLFPMKVDIKSHVISSLRTLLDRRLSAFGREMAELNGKRLRGTNVRFAHELYLILPRRSCVKCFFFKKKVVEMIHIEAC